MWQMKILLETGELFMVFRTQYSSSTDTMTMTAEVCGQSTDAMRKLLFDHVLLQIINTGAPFVVLEKKSCLMWMDCFVNKARAVSSHRTAFV